jgi:hypothetical protein
MAKTFYGADARPRPKIKHFDSFFVLGCEKQPIAFQVEAKMVKISRVTEQWSCRNQLQWKLPLCASFYRKDRQCNETRRQ